MLWIKSFKFFLKSVSVVNTTDVRRQFIAHLRSSNSESWLTKQILYLKSQLLFIYILHLFQCCFPMVLIMRWQHPALVMVSELTLRYSTWAECHLVTPCWSWMLPHHLAVWLYNWHTAGEQRLLLLDSVCRHRTFAAVYTLSCVCKEVHVPHIHTTMAVIIAAIVHHTDCLYSALLLLLLDY